MTQDKAGAGVRERIWVVKVDHTVEPPQPIEEVFVENGEVKEVRDMRPELVELAPEEQKQKP